MSLMLRKYDLKTITRIPSNLLVDGTSWRVNIAVKTVKAGVNELIGARSEIEDNFIAQRDNMNATRSKIAETNISTVNLLETW